MDHLVLPHRLYEQIVDHVQRALPLEAVGMLGGHQYGKVTMAIPLENLSGPGGFFVDPYCQFQAQRKLKESGLSLLAVYHSHPGGGAQPSITDLRFAASLDLVQIIIALARPHLPDIEVRGYRMAQTKVVDVHLLIEME
jgi:[CysO sulfur-carrier protein]-S-L-cysteine hydrolase